MFACFDKRAWRFQGKRLVAVAAAKRHMVVMSSDGDIYTWGHRVVTPRRVQLAGETPQVNLLCHLLLFCFMPSCILVSSLFEGILQSFQKHSPVVFWQLVCQ